MQKTEHICLTFLTHPALGCSERIEVNQHGVSVVFMLVPEVDPRLGGKDLLHTLSCSPSHLNAVGEQQHITM